MDREIRHNSIYASGKLLRETITTTVDDVVTDTDVLDFFYNQNGQPYSFTYNGTEYFYILNLQGDVEHIYDTDGNSVALYNYNAWGEVINQSGTMADVNPIRYRGYYYDAELEMYYLQSRYYDPAICRFINADSLVSTGQGFLGYNMFAYCNNRPALSSDPTGHAARGTNTVVICDGGSRYVDNPYYWNDPSRPYAREAREFEEKESMKRILEDNKSGKYKDTTVIVLPFLGDDAFSFGFIFMGSNYEYDDRGITTLKHEYGHYIQYTELGVVDYTRYIAYPSVIGYWNDAPNYFSQPWEYLADLFGKVDRNGYTYTADAHENAIIYWENITNK